jgi:hypothetical protein
MLVSALLSLLVGVPSLALGAAVGRVGARDGSEPSLIADPSTTTWCTWWADLTVAKTCSKLLSDNEITLEQFRRWVSTGSPSECHNMR